MINKSINIVLLILILFIFQNCKNSTVSSKSIKKELLQFENKNLSYIIKKNNPDSIFDIKITDNNYYYLFGRILYEKNNNDIWAKILLKRAINTDNIFREDALFLYINDLIKNNSFVQVKDLILKNKDFLKSKNYSFLIDYSLNKNLNEISNIPHDQFYFLLLYEIIKNNPNDLNDKLNLTKIHNYFIKTNIYEKNEINYLNKFRDIVEWSKYDNFLSMVYYYKIKNKKLFYRSLESFLINNNESITDEYFEIIKKFSISLGLRKDLYNLLSKFGKNNRYLKYYYGMDVIYFENYRKGIDILKSILPYFNEKSMINYNIRYQLLYNTRNMSKKWIEDVILFFNDYPDFYKSKLLLNQIILYGILQKKENFVAPLLKNITSESMDVLDRTIFYYQMYLMDKNNQEYWKNILTEEYPFSYPTLSLNKGVVKNIDNKNNKYFYDINLLSNDAKNKLLKVKYLLEFSYYNDALKIDVDDLNSNEKIPIMEVFYQYYMKNSNYYDALKCSKKIANLVYNGNNCNIDNLEILKRLYPLHYKEYILKYSKIYNIDPALAFAVMREESYFNKDIVSYQGAVGLMQIMPGTGRFISKKIKIKNYNLYNPEDNIRMGIYYLNFLKNYFNNNQLILSSYNAGHGKTKRWFNVYNKYPEEVFYEIIPIYETRHYIRKVMTGYYIYKYLLEFDEKNNT